MRVAIIDYGAGNLFSITNAFLRAGAEVRVVSYMSPEPLNGYSLVVLPGVGSFGQASRALSMGLRDELIKYYEGGGAILGVCLGMHLLYESSEEGSGSGLSIFKGRVRRITGRRVPHMGWTYTRPVRPSSLLEGVDGAWYYYAHSYAVGPEEPKAVAVAEHEGQPIAAAVEEGAAMATQFHPEKSGSAGAVVIANALRAARR